MASTLIKAAFGLLRSAFGPARIVDSNHTGFVRRQKLKAFFCEKNATKKNQAFCAEVRLIAFSGRRVPPWRTRLGAPEKAHGFFRKKKVSLKNIALRTVIVHSFSVIQQQRSKF